METSNKQKIVMDELAGKNNAIQTYDQTLWKIRSGFLTLLFAGWGALLSFLGDNPEMIAPFTAAMFCVSVGLSVAGLLIDLDYIERKYRCIVALRLLLEDAWKHIDEPDEFENKDKWLRISGDDTDIDFTKPPCEPYEKNSYKRARKVPFLIYLGALASILVGLIALITMELNSTCSEIPV